MVGVSLRQPIRRMPIIDPDKRLRIFQRMHDIRGEISAKYQDEVYIIDLAKAIATGSRTNIIEILKKHPLIHKEIYAEDEKITESAMNILRLLREIYVEAISDIVDGKPKWGIFREKEEEIIIYLDQIKHQMPYSYKILMQAINNLKNVIAGKTRAQSYASEFAWIGENTEDGKKPGKIVLALSGGSSKGVFYIGFLKALREAELWPDFIVGTSAGALAGATLADSVLGKRTEDKISINRLRKIFGLKSLILTFFLSLGGGIIGRGFGKYMKEIFGNRTFSDIADLFVVTTVQSPVNFGKTVIGRGSEINGNIQLSSDIAVWKAVWGSCAMQGIIHRPSLDTFSAQRLELGENGVERHGITVRKARLDDGGMVENLPLLTAELLLKEIKELGLIISVNLANLNPIGAEVPKYFTFREIIRAENAKLGKDANLFQRTGAFFVSLRKYLKQVKKRFVYDIAPMRVYMGHEANDYQTVIQTVNLLRGKGLKILINPNEDGSLSRITLTSMRGAEDVIDEGYKMGKELVRILLG